MSISITKGLHLLGCCFLGVLQRQDLETKKPWQVNAGLVR